MLGVNNNRCMTVSRYADVAVAVADGNDTAGIVEDHGRHLLTVSSLNTGLLGQLVSESGSIDIRLTRVAPRAAWVI